MADPKPPPQSPRVEQAMRAVEAGAEAMGVRLTHDESVALILYVAQLQKQAYGARAAFRAGVEWSARYLENEELEGMAVIMRTDAARLLTDEQIDQLRKDLAP